MPLMMYRYFQNEEIDEMSPREVCGEFAALINHIEEELCNEDEKMQEEE